MIHFRLFQKARYFAFLGNFELSETCHRGGAKNSTDFAVVQVELEFGPEVHIRNPVTVGDGKVLKWVRLYDFVECSGNPTAGHAIDAGIDHADAPLLLGCIVPEGLGRIVKVGPVVDHQVVGSELIVQEELFDFPGAVTGADHEVIESVGVVPAHDVHQDGDLTDLDHRFGFELGFFGDSGPQAAGQDEYGYILGFGHKTVRLQRANWGKDSAMSNSQNHSAESWKNSKVFITGSTGLLGSHLTRALVESGAEVVALVRDSIPKSLFYSNEPGWKLPSRLVTIRGQVEDYSLIERVLNEYEIDTVFHLAAQTLVGTANTSPIPTFRANIEGTWNVLEACRVHQKRIKRVVVASSDKAYGNLNGEAYDESFPLNGEHPYDVSKSCSDLLAKAYYVSYKLPVAITRCGNFFGPGDLNYSRIIPGTIRDVARGQRPVIRSNGQFIRDYIFAEDGAQAYMTLAEKMEGGKFAGEAFNFSYGLRLKVVDVVSAVLKQMGREDLEPVIQNGASNEIPVQCLNSDKAKSLLDWRPRYGFDEGLKKTVSWYQRVLE